MLLFKNSNYHSREFSKALLMQESFLIWIVTISMIILAFYCISQGYIGTLPWISGLIAMPWAAYGVSQGFYYNKAKAENTMTAPTYQDMVQQVKETIENSSNEDSSYI